MTELSRHLLEHGLVSRGAAVGTGVPERLMGLSTDTRTLSPGALFVALVGERFDGHAFVAEALGKGAAAAVVARDRVPEGVSPERLVLVDDTLLALQDLAAAHLDALPARRVAIAGSNGKTTTKELAAASLRACLGEEAVLATEGNLNNHIGVPLTALRATARHRVIVFEMGMNHFGEIARLCEIARPEVGLVTNIGTAHAGNVGGIEGVAKAECELFEALPEEGVGVVNLEDPRCVAQARARLKGRTLGFGRGEGADLRIVSVEPTATAGVTLKLRYDGQSALARVPVEGLHSALNAAGAVAMALALGFDLETAASGLERARPVKGRLTRLSLPQGGLLLDDTYNANPESMRVGLETLAALAGDRPRVAVLGQMLELDQPERYHEEVGRFAVKRGVALLFACGELGRGYVEGARRAGLDDGAAFWAEDSAALANVVAERLPEGAAVLVKGSRGARMEMVVERLIGEGRR